MRENNVNDGLKARASSPENDPALSDVVRELRAWSNEGVSVPRLDMAQLRAVLEQSEAGHSGRQRSIWLAAGWVLAAASLCFLALSNGQFRFEWGSFNIQIGNGNSGKELRALRAQVADIRQRCELNQSEYSATIDTLSDRTIALENDLQATAVKLIRAQEAESATRFTEISRILSMTSRID